VEWPLFDLRLQCGPVSLRAVTDDDLTRLAAILPDDVDLDPRAERFVGLEPGPDRLRRFVQGIWRSRGTWSPGSWCLDLLVEVDGEPVGLQSLEGEDFPRLRTVDSGSWLVPTARGRGLGVAMRTAVLGLAFDHLDAVAAVSSAVLDNAASLGVSRRLGYADNGISRTDSPAGVVELQHLRLTRDTWLAGRHRVAVTGLEPCRAWFGLGGRSAPATTAAIATAAGSACTTRIRRLTVAAPKTPATTTQPRKNSWTVASSAANPQTRPATRKPL
jgi:RimJ/RimL family protein N-acetyltransferase